MSSMLPVCLFTSVLQIAPISMIVNYRDSSKYSSHLNLSSPPGGSSCRWRIESIIVVFDLIVALHWWSVDTIMVRWQGGDLLVLQPSCHALQEFAWAGCAESPIERSSMSTVYLQPVLLHELS
jgi:hypothetical protein